MKKISYYFFVLSILIFTSFSYTQQKVAIITNVVGKVEVQRSETGRWQEATVNTALFAKDVIKTYKKSTCEIVFADETIVKITENAILQLKVPSEKKRAKEKGIIADIKLTLGRIFTRVKRAVAREKGFNVETPAAIIGVRGTLFSTEVTADGDTLVSVKEGVVEVFGEETSIILEEGEQVEILAEIMEPGEAQPLTEEEEKQWEEQEVWLEEVEEKVEEEPREEEKVEVGILPVEEEEVGILPIIEEEEIEWPTTEDIIDIEEELEEIEGKADIMDVIDIDETIIEIITEQEIIDGQPEDTVGTDKTIKELEIEEEKIQK